MNDVAGVRADLEAAYSRFLGAVADIPEMTLETEPALGAWSPRDVTGHVADWQSEMLGAAKHILGDRKPRGHPIKNGQGYNTTQAALRGTDSWGTAIGDFQQIFSETFEFLDNLDDAQLNAIGPYPWGEIGKLQGLLRDMQSHMNEHAEQLAAWRLQRTGAYVDRGHE